MLRKLCPLFACAAILLLAGLAIRGYDARRDFPTPRREYSTPPVVATRANPDSAASRSKEPLPAVPVAANTDSGLADPLVASSVQDVPPPSSLPSPDQPSPQAVKIVAGTQVNRAVGTYQPPPSETPQDLVPSPSPPLPVQRASPDLPAPPPHDSPLPLVPQQEPPLASPPAPTLLASPSVAPSSPPPEPLPDAPAPAVVNQTPPSPWTFQIAVVSGRTQLEARNGDEVQFTVTCDHLNMQSPKGQVCATGSVLLSGRDVEGTCEKLTLGWQDEKVLLEGKVHLQCKQEGQQVHLSGEQLSVKLAVIETLPPPAPAE